MVNDTPNLDLVTTHELAHALMLRLQTGLLVYVEPGNGKRTLRSAVAGKINLNDGRAIGAAQMVLAAHPRPPEKKGKKK